MKIGIIVAMDKELHQLRQLFNDGNVRVEKCGIGKVNAALGAQRMINEFHPDCIISSGCAGGNGNDISIQDVVVSAVMKAVSAAISASASRFFSRSFIVLSPFLIIGRLRSKLKQKF